MGKVTHKFDRKDAKSLPIRKRWRKNSENIHSKILNAKRNLENVGQNGSKGKQSRLGAAKIRCRLLPSPVFEGGIFIYGKRGKDIRKEGSENKITKARLEGDALNLLDGNTSESDSESIVEPQFDDVIEQRPNEECVDNNCETSHLSKQSPILSRRQSKNQESCPDKKEPEEILDGDLIDFTEQDVTDEVNHINHKRCRRRLPFSKEELKYPDDDLSGISGFDDAIDLSKTNVMNEEKKPKVWQLKHGIYSYVKWNPLTRYSELNARVSDENFKIDFQKNHELSSLLSTPSIDPLTETTNKLRQAYKNSYQEQYLRTKYGPKLLDKLNTLNALSNEDSTCSDSPQLFEIPKHTDNCAIGTCSQEGMPEKDIKFKSPLIHENDKNSTSYASPLDLSGNSVVAECNTSSIAEDNSNNEQYIGQPSTYYIWGPNSSSMAEKNFVLDSQKDSDFANRPSTSNHHSKEDNFFINIPNYPRYIDKEKYFTSIFSDDSTDRNLSKTRFRENLPTEPNIDCKSIATTSARDVLWGSHNRTISRPDIMQISMPLPVAHRYNTTINNVNPDGHDNKNYTPEDLRRNSEIVPFDQKYLRNDFSTRFENVPTSTAIDWSFNPSEKPTFESHRVGMKDPQELKVKKRDVYPKQSDEENRCWRYNFLQPTSSRNENIEELSQQQQSRISDHSFHLNNNRPTYYVQNASSSNFFTRPTEQHLPQRINLQNDQRRYIGNIYNTQQMITEDTFNQNQNDFVNSVENGAIARTGYNLMCNSNKGSKLRDEMCCKRNIQHVKDHINDGLNNYGQTYTYHESSNRSPKYGIPYVHHEEIVQTQPAQPGISSDPRNHNNNTDNRVNFVYEKCLRNMRSLPMEYKPYIDLQIGNNRHHTVVLQDAVQPVKYLAVNDVNSANMHKIAIYNTNDNNTEIIENVPLNAVMLMDMNSQTN